MGHGKPNPHSTAAHHIIPLDVYIKVFVALIIFTVITVAASRVDFGIFNDIVAFGIATIKAILVMAYFMHLKYDDKLNRVIFLSSAFFLIVLFFFCSVDEGTRIIQKSVL